MSKVPLLLFKGQLMHSFRISRKHMTQFGVIVVEAVGDWS